MSAEASSKAFALAAWFLFFFVVRHSIGHTLIMIPYDALGQELTTDSDTRRVRTPRARLTHARAASHPEKNPGPRAETRVPPHSTPNCNAPSSCPTHLLRLGQTRVG